MTHQSIHQPHKPTQLWEQPPTEPSNNLIDLAGNDGRPLVDIAKPNQDVAVNPNPSPTKNLTHQVIALGAGVVTLGVAVVGGVSYARNSQNSAQSVSVPEQVQPVSGEAVKKANETARDLANGVIKILAKPGSGAKAYRGDMVGNKTAVIGPDGKFPSADDNKTPESFVGFDPAKGEMYVSSTQEYFPNGIKDQKHSEFTRILLTLEVDKDNSIYDAKGQLQITDYEKALSQPDTLQLKSVEAGLRTGGINPAPEVSVAVNDEGKLQATVYENGQYAKNPDTTKAAEGETTFGGVIVRANQIEEAALEDLQNSAR